MPTPSISIVLFLVAAVLGAAGQYLYKSGADAATGGVSSYLLNARLLGGVVCYVGVMVFFVAAFKRGGSLSVLYPLYATTFIWAAVITWVAYCSSASRSPISPSLPMTRTTAPSFS